MLVGTGEIVKEELASSSVEKLFGIQLVEYDLGTVSYEIFS